MKAYLILTYILTHCAISTVTSLSCYKCSSSDEKNCELLQKIQLCKSKEDMCISLKSSYGFVKKCATIGQLGCEYPCKALLIMGAKSCKVKSCCKNSMCNKREEKTIICKSRNKDYETSATRYVIATALVLCVILFH